MSETAKNAEGGNLKPEGRNFETQVSGLIPHPSPQRPTELPPEIAAKLEKRKRFPRARRWLFNFAAALSLVLFVGNHYLWFRGMNSHRDAWISPRVGEWSTYISSKGAKLFFGLNRINAAALGRASSGNYWMLRFGFQSVDYPDPTGVWRGDDNEIFGWFEKPSGNDIRYGAGLIWRWSQIGVPKWFLQLLFAILPLWWLGRFALRRSEKRGVRDET